MTESPPPAAARPGRPALLVPANDDHRGGLIAVMVCALLLRLWQLGRESLWTDEGSAWTAAMLPFRQLIDFCLHRDASPPLYYLLVSLAMRLGHSETSLRLVSVLASTAMVYVTYRIARLVADRRTSTIAAALTALSPYQIMYAQEARTYALVALWVVLGMYLFLRAVVLDRPRAWMPFLLVTTLGLWTQSLSVLGLGAQGVIVLFTRAGRRQLWRWAILVAVAGLCFLPWMLLSISGSDISSSHWYIRNPSGHTSFQVLRSLVLSPISLVTPPGGAAMPGLERAMPRSLAWLLLFGIPVVALLAAFPRLRDTAPRGPLARAILAALTLPLVAVFLVSFKRPLWLPRYFVMLSPFLSVLMALGVRSLRPARLSAAWLGLLLLVYGYGTFRYFTDYTKERWRDAVHLVAATSAPERTAVIVTFDADPFLFYDGALDHPYRVFAAAHPHVPFHDAFTDAQLAQIERSLRDSTARFDDVWVVVRSPNSAPRRRVAEIANTVAADGRARISGDTLIAVQGPLRLARYLRPRPLGADTLRADGR